MKKYVICFFFYTSWVNVSAISLDAADIGSSCINIKTNLKRGDASAEVYKLQEFLFVQDLLSEKPTGFFGDLTKQAVKEYQNSIGIKETGMVYELTRQAIFTETCN
jgi:murein L,D-transpeptidase YcbB/YkuD